MPPNENILSSRSVTSASPPTSPNAAFAAFHSQSHIHRLPAELWCIIFKYVTAADTPDTSSPLILSHVSSQWRQIALSTGALWKSLIMTFPSSPGQVSRLIAWLSRSKNYPLDIALDFRDPSWDWDWDEDSHAFHWQDMEAVIRILLLSVHRWRSFELLTDTWAPIYTFLWYTQKAESAPQLENLVVSRCNAYFAAKGESFQPKALREPLLLFGGITLDRLKEVSLAGVHVDWAASHLRGLTKLELKYHAQEVLPTIDEFMSILDSCPELEELSILGWGPRFESSEEKQAAGKTPEIKLEKVRRFTFGFVDGDYALQFLSCISMPILSELVLEDVCCTVDPDRHPDGENVLGWIISQCPMTSFDDQDTEAAGPFLLKNLRTLELRHIQASKARLSSFFEHCTAVGRLCLYFTTVDVLDVVFPGPAEEPPFRCPCPQLTQLFCAGYDSTTLCKSILPQITQDHDPLLKELHYEGNFDSTFEELERVGIRVVNSPII